MTNREWFNTLPDDVFVDRFGINDSNCPPNITEEQKFCSKETELCPDCPDRAYILCKPCWLAWFKAEFKENRQ